MAHQVLPAAPQQPFGARIEISDAPVAVQRQETVGQGIERGAVDAGRQARRRVGEGDESSLAWFITFRISLSTINVLFYRIGESA
ncbi:hypothetical protein WJ978_28530 [Achromobacter xylosoxidans]